MTVSKVISTVNTISPLLKTPFFSFLRIAFKYLIRLTTQDSYHL